MAASSLLLKSGVSERTFRVRKKAEAIWRKPLLRQYTDHTIDHADRIVEILDKLCALLVKPLTNDEAYVLICAAYLHDIGMQQERFFETEVVQKRFTQDEIAEAIDDQEEREAIIRQWHHLVSEERIKYELGRNYLDEEYIAEVALVARGHSKEKLESYTDRTKAGKPMRLRLLAALLRFADELDLDYRRVNLDELQQAIISNESLAHWWKCHYVESVDVEGDGGIQITYCFSEKDSEEVAQVVSFLVNVGLQRKLHRDKLLDILWPYLRVRLVDIPKINPPSAGKRPVPHNVLELYKREVFEITLQQAAVEFSEASSPEGHRFRPWQLPRPSQFGNCPESSG